MAVHDDISREAKGAAQANTKHLLNEKPLPNGNLNSSSPCAPLDASKLNITLTTAPRLIPQPGSAEEKSQKICTDHMISASWTAEEGWKRPEIQPYGALNLMPTANVFHYATECFEGLKLYRGDDGKLRLFRPLDNCVRMANSASRISLPSFEPEQLLKLIRKLCEIDGPRWLPKDRKGTFLYIRPAMIGTDPCLGFEVPREALLFVVISYWPQPAAPCRGEGLRLYASKADEIRAWPGGAGHAKIGPNYGPALRSHGQARQAGYNQVLWLYGKDCQITEAGSSNVFVLLRSKHGQLQMVTAPLSDGTILDGVTRRSVLQICRERFSLPCKINIDDGEPQQVEEVEVIERKITMGEVIAAQGEDRLISFFVVGTAAFVTPVSHVNFRGQELRIDTERSSHVSLLRHWIADIMYGRVQSDWVEVVDEAE